MKPSIDIIRWYVSDGASSKLGELYVYSCVASRVHACGGLSSCFVHSDILTPVRATLIDVYIATDSAVRFITEFTVA